VTSDSSSSSPLPSIIALPRGVHAIQLDAAPPLDLTPAEAAAWAAMQASNPRLHDGTFASVTDLIVPSTPDAAVIIRARREHFARLVIEHPQQHPRLLGLKAILLGIDARATPHVFIQRRHHQTRVYPGYWEIGPGGGLDVTGLSQHISAGALFAHLLTEISAEIGIDAPSLLGRALAAPPRALFAVDDTLARSLDLCFVLPWPGVIDPTRAPGDRTRKDWEATEAQWLSKAEAPRFVNAHGPHIAPPSLAILRHKGWLA